MEEEFECPYCDYTKIVEGHELPYDDEEEYDVDCKSCGREFTIVAHTTVNHDVHGKRKYTKDCIKYNLCPNSLEDSDFDWEEELKEED